MSVKNVVKAAKDHQWWYLSSLILMLLMWMMKTLGSEARLGFWPKLGRWRYIIAPVLSITAALLAAFQGGVSIEVAIGVFTSTYATSSIQEFWEHGILGLERESTKRVNIMTSTKKGIG